MSDNGKIVNMKCAVCNVYAWEFIFINRFFIGLQM